MCAGRLRKVDEGEMRWRIPCAVPGSSGALHPIGKATRDAIRMWQFNNHAPEQSIHDAATSGFLQCDAANSAACVAFYSVALLSCCSYNDMGCLRASNSLRHCLHSAQRRCLATHSRSIDSISETPLSNLEKNVSLPYPHLQNNLRTIRHRLDRPLTLSEKILFSHLYYPETQELTPGRSSLQLRPDRAACHDATATMAMLQFISAGLSRVALPTSIHSDHLIVAEKGARADLEKAKADYAEVR